MGSTKGWETLNYDMQYAPLNIQTLQDMTTTTNKSYKQDIPFNTYNNGSAMSFCFSQLFLGEFIQPRSEDMNTQYLIHIVKLKSCAKDLISCAKQ